jgi:tRNA pseudouridine38-40 synthase
MAEAARHLLGVHDFEAFRSVGCDAPHAVREIRRAEVTRAGEEITVELTGSAFLRNMVRIIVGTLEEVGRGRRTAAEIPALLAGRDRSKAGITAPAQGLMLHEVFYEDVALETWP